MTTLPLLFAHAEGAASPALPAYQTEHAAGLDLVADAFDLPGEPRARSTTLAPGARVLARTGLRVAVPPGHVGLVCPRSGLALRLGLTVANAPGIIDEDFRGELCVLLVNLGEGDVPLARGMRIAQLVVVPVARATVLEAPDLPPSGRGFGGFGSTGT